VRRWDRTLALPSAPRSPQAQDVRAWRKKRAAIAEQNALRPTITRISWGRLRYGKGRIVRDAEGAQVFVYEDDQAVDQTGDATQGAAAAWSPEASPEATAATGVTAQDDAGDIDARVGGAPPNLIQTHNRAHARLLIAGGGRRWKKTQVIPVRPSREYVREVSARHSGHSRIAVIGGPLGGPLDQLRAAPVSAGDAP
jgi:hypothetical protein